jgi:hypothetical protein
MGVCAKFRRVKASGGRYSIPEMTTWRFVRDVTTGKEFLPLVRERPSAQTGLLWQVTRERICRAYAFPGR